MTATHLEHKSQAPQSLRCAVITVSDTRTLENDRGGQSVIDHLKTAGHQIVQREIVPDDPARMRPLLDDLCGRGDVDAILLTGGTGVTSRDQTYETVSGLLDKPMPGYGEIFRMLSYEEIGPAACLSRAVGGIARGKVVLTMPGSPAGVRLAMERIIVPELSHFVREARR
ncbi:MAG TPA: molybdenum cofactor biosynthesis protein B [Pirellulaceae bacterium]|nr:molybdenum cofactor biosynthesis protein B [Pirellulaceae bacterium]